MEIKNHLRFVMGYAPTDGLLVTVEWEYNRSIIRIPVVLDTIEDCLDFIMAGNRNEWRVIGANINFELYPSIQWMKRQHSCKVLMPTQDCVSSLRAFDKVRIERPLLIAANDQNVEDYDSQTLVWKFVGSDFSLDKLSNILCRLHAAQ